MSDQFIQGMTVNERLYHFGLMDAFDAAAMSRDLEALLKVLLQARFSEEQARSTATTLFADPARYGY